MDTQNQIKRTLTKPGIIEQIRQMLNGSKALIRTILADDICQRFGFFDARGNKQRSTCLKALRDLEGEGHFVLPPAATAKRGKPTPRRLPEAVPDPQDVPAMVEAIQGLRLVIVETEQQMRMWNEMMIREHPRGACQMVGRQLRYLIGSDHGWLGGLGFGAAALQLQDRDRWIGWDVEARRAQLHRVAGLSRLLIRTEVHCQNLASRVLGLCLEQFPKDFEARFGFCPWLVETFVDTSHSGTCFRAANWERIGQTQGRGRQDRDRTLGETVKDIYVYPLERSFRTLMGVPQNDRGEAPPLRAQRAGAAHCAAIGGARWRSTRVSRPAVGQRRSSAELHWVISDWRSG